MAVLQMTVGGSASRAGYRFIQPSCDIIGNFIVDWGDGCIEVNTEYHVYKQAELYQITVKGDFEMRHIQFPQSIISLDKEEGCGITSLEKCFYRCFRLKSVPHDWDLSKVTDMSRMFQGCSSFNQDISYWDLSKVVNTSYMFYSCFSFNQDLSNWDLSHIKNKVNMATSTKMLSKHKPRGLRKGDKKCLQK